MDFSSGNVGWQEDAGKKLDFVVNINVSHRQIERLEFRDDLEKILEETGFPPENLCIELTERCSNMNLEVVQREMEYLHSRGIKLALDDFGTGGASLVLLRELPIDILKIDQTFLADITQNAGDQAIVESIISCSQKMGIQVCLEGIANKELRDFVRRYPVHHYQGYYYSRPLKFHKFIKLL